MTPAPDLATLAATFSVPGDIRERASFLERFLGCHATIDGVGNVLFQKGTPHRTVVLMADDPAAIATGGRGGKELALFGLTEPYPMTLPAYDKEGEEVLLKRGEGGLLTMAPLAPGQRLRLGPRPKVIDGRLVGTGAAALGFLWAAALAFQVVDQGAMLLAAYGRRGAAGLSAHLSSASGPVLLPVPVTGARGSGVVRVASRPYRQRLPDADAFLVEEEIPLYEPLLLSGRPLDLLGIPVENLGQPTERLIVRDLEALTAQLVEELSRGTASIWQSRQRLCHNGEGTPSDRLPAGTEEHQQHPGEDEGQFSP